LIENRPDTRDYEVFDLNQDVGEDVEWFGQPYLTNILPGGEYQPSGLLYITNYETREKLRARVKVKTEYPDEESIFRLGSVGFDLIRSFKELVRSELFGYCKGAFTGATASQEGLLALAHMGTFFLDEIGELPLEVQASLLRVIEKQTFRRVGDQQERQVDVRFIFATNRNLAEEVKTGRFHEALFHRINVFHIDVLPLRERREDIPILVDFYLDLLCMGRPPCRVSKEVMEYLMAYHWPGNVRELRNVLERGIILSENGWITPRALPKELREQKIEEREEPVLVSLEDVEKRHILKVLELVNHNRSQAAELLGIGRKTLYRKLKDYKDYNVT